MKKRVTYENCARYFQTRLDEHADDDDTRLMLNLLLLLVAKEEKDSQEEEIPNKIKGMFVIRKPTFSKKRL